MNEHSTKQQRYERMKRNAEINAKTINAWLSNPSGLSYTSISGNKIGKYLPQSIQQKLEPHPIKPSHPK